MKRSVTNTPPVLSHAERSDFALVVDSAMSMGWLRPDDEISAERSDHAVTVRVLRDGRRIERRYQDDDAWLFHFLRELAQGDWQRSDAVVAESSVLH